LVFAVFGVSVCPSLCASGARSSCARSDPCSAAATAHGQRLTTQADTTTRAAGWLLQGSVRTMDPLARSAECTATRQGSQPRRTPLRRLRQFLCGRTAQSAAPTACNASTQCMSTGAQAEALLPLFALAGRRPASRGTNAVEAFHVRRWNRIWTRS
jgi:hypothetical protein